MENDHIVIYESRSVDLFIREGIGKAKLCFKHCRGCLHTRVRIIDTR
jgi:hypothetical protein